MKKLHLQKKDVVYLLIIANLIIWTIATVKTKNFYNYYISLVVSGAKAQEKTILSDKIDVLEPLGSKEWILSEWGKIGQREQAYAVIQCESRFDPWAIGDQGNSRGLYQIHKKYNPGVTTECAFSPVCSTEWAIKEVQKNGWQKWSCAKNLGIN